MSHQTTEEEYADSLRAIEEGLADIKAARTASIDHVFRELDQLKPKG